MKAIDMSEWDTYMKCMLVGRNAWDDYDRGYTDAMDQMDDWLDAQPTLALDDLRQKGRWDLDEKRRRYCTNCKKVAIQFENKAYYVPGFCYHCGADMRGGEEECSD